MSDDPSTWPEELRSAWAKTGLPGLRDFLLAQERLAMEVRKQNRELRRLADAAAGSDEADDAAPDESFFLLADAVERLRASLLDAAATIALRPAKRRLFGLLPPAPAPDHGPLLQGLVSGSELLGERLRDLLRAEGIEPISPAIGEAFDPVLHQAVELSDAAGAGRIDTLIRPGYRRGEHVFRPAEVSVGRRETDTREPT